MNNDLSKLVEAVRAAHADIAPHLRRVCTIGFRHRYRLRGGRT